MQRPSQFLFAHLLMGIFLFTACGEDTDIYNADPIQNPTDQAAISEVFADRIDLSNLYNYANQPIPGYIDKDNTQSNPIADISATLGRVLFYDTNLSIDNTISCASCHKQQFAFGDPNRLSTGVNGVTGRHSMRLINSRFAREARFFWDERASSLEQQTTMPIQDHIEMGFSGQDGHPSFTDLIEKLSAFDYYRVLFRQAFGDETITEARIQNAIAQFIRSMQSFDSRYDLGRAGVNNNNANFPNFTAVENLGKNLFMQPAQFQDGSGIRLGGGLGCNSCHQAPEFDIDPDSRNNGVIRVAGLPDALDVGITRSPSLRDLFNMDGDINTPFMHTGDFTTIDQVIDHYDRISVAGNNNLDRRLARGGGVQLNITPSERAALIAFLRTLSGSDIYENEKWSDPF